jgi:TatD DNase family protein
MELTRAELIDCHLHLQDPELRPHLDEVIARARAVGVARLIVNSTSEDDWPAVRELARDREDVVPCFGIHPWFASECSPHWRRNLREILESTPSGVGEIGLDRWVEHRDEDAQEEIFRGQLEIACRLERPVTIHGLKAWGWLVRVLQRARFVPDVMHVHAYGGAVKHVEPLLELGAYFSFAGDVLRSDRKQGRVALRAVPLDRLLLETDAPDMPPPTAYRERDLRDVDGKLLNEPANLPAIVRGLAEIRGEDPRSLAVATTANARRVFGDLIA